MGDTRPDRSESRVGKKGGSYANFNEDRTELAISSNGFVFNGMSSLPFMCSPALLQHQSWAVFTRPDRI